MILEEKLEELKQIGIYAIQLWFGEDVGCDDLSVPLVDRRIVVMGFPVGCLGSTKVLFKGKLKELLSFDFYTKPKILPNPPETEDWDGGGWFIWGTEDSVKEMAERFVKKAK